MVMKRVIIGLLLSAALYAPSALSAVPLVLPAGQVSGEWAAAASGRGMEVRAGALPRAGPGVVLLDQGDHWNVQVRDWKGGEQSIDVAPCTNEQEREDLLFLVSMLVGKAPEPAPVVGVPPPVPTPVPVVPPAPTPAPVASVPAVIPPAPAETPPATSLNGVPNAGAVEAPAGQSSAGIWVSAGGGLGFRPAVGVVGDFRIDGGWHVTRALRVGLGLAFRTAAALPAAGADRQMTDFDLVLEGAWVSEARLAPYAGAYLGMAARSFTSAGEPLVEGALPILGAEGGVIIPLGELPLAAAPSGRIQTDLRGVQIISAAGTTALSPIEVRAGLMLVYRPR